MTDDFTPTMHTIVVEKTELLDILRKNREKHIAEYNEAKEGYQQAVIDKLSDALKAARKGDTEAWRMQLPKPQSYEKQYDVAIRKMELSTHNVVHLADGEFQQYVMDQWQWSQQFSETTSNYMASSKR